MNGRFSLALTLALGVACAQGAPSRTDGVAPAPDAQADAAPDAGPTDAPRDVRDSQPADAPPTDAPPDRHDAPTPECAADGDCSDSVRCNGDERCVLGECVAGSPIACDDGVGCTVDTCDEATGACSFTPSDALCGADESCSATEDCKPGCAETPCSLVSPQCGCDGGDACYLTLESTRACLPEGTAAEGETCAAPEDCGGGSVCLNVARAGVATRCVRFCDTDLDCAGEGSLCLLTVDDGTGGAVEDATLCTRACDPVTQDGCPFDQACHVYQEPDGEKRAFTDCEAPYGFGWQGDPCLDNADCMAGFLCVDPDGAGSWEQQCMAWCEVETGTGCIPGETCFSFATPVVVGGTEYGLCG